MSGNDLVQAEQKVALLRKLGCGSLLMLPIVVGDATWGLAEIYGSSPYVDGDVARAAPVVSRAGELISTLES